MESLEDVIGYTFQDKALLRQALTHPSLGYETKNRTPDNQRLEFLGDAVIQLILSNELYKILPGGNAGKMSVARVHLVSEPSLARLARQLGLGEHMLLGRGEAANGGRGRDTLLGDAMEALMGAIYLDGGMTVATEVANRLFATGLQEIKSGQTNHNPKGTLQELTQAVSEQSPTYTILSATGPDHARKFEANVTWDGVVWGRGIGHSKKDAEVKAAENALSNAALHERLQDVRIP